MRDRHATFVAQLMMLATAVAVSIFAAGCSPHEDPPVVASPIAGPAAPIVTKKTDKTAPMAGHGAMMNPNWNGGLGTKAK